MLMEGLPYSSYSDIDKNMECSVLNFMRSDETELEDEYLDKLIADLNNFRDKWTIVSDAAEIDRLIVGEERQNLVDFISKKKTSGVGVQDKVENKDALANTNRLLTSPAPKGGSKMVDVEINPDEL